MQNPLSFLDNIYERKARRLSAVVTNVPVVNGRSTGNVVCSIGPNAGQYVAFDTDRNPPAVGDNVYVVQRGDDANAQYVFEGYSAVVRPTSGVTQFMDRTVVGDDVIEGGDIYLGDHAGGPNTWISSGSIRLRVGSVDRILLQADSGGSASVRIGQYTAGKPNVLITDSQIALRVYDSPSIVLGTNGEITASNKITAGTANNVGVLDGADSAYRIYAGHTIPASAPFRVDKYGSIVATAGSIGGWALSSSTLLSDSGNALITAGASPSIRLGSLSGFEPVGEETAPGLWMGKDSGTYKFFIGQRSSGQYMQFNGTTLSIGNATISDSAIITGTKAESFTINTNGDDLASHLRIDRGLTSVKLTWDGTRLVSNQPIEITTGSAAGAGAPLVIGTNGLGQLVTGLNADQLDGYHASQLAISSITITAGSGLIGGGNISADRTLHVGPGDGIDSDADSIAVDVTDFIDTAAGLKEDASNNIQINAGTGLTFSGGSAILDQSISPTWTGSHLFKPASNSTTTLQVQPSASTAPVIDVDTTNSRVGIGTAAPKSRLHISDGTAPSLINNTEIVVISNADNQIIRPLSAGATASSSGIITFTRSRGTLSSPTVVSSGDQIGAVNAQGYDGFGRQNMAGMYFEVDGTPGSNDMPGRIVFKTTPDGSATLAERMRINSGGSVRVGDDTNNVTFDSTGHLTWAGTGKPWTDVRIEPVARTTGANAPAFRQFYDDAGIGDTGATRGVYLYEFDDANAGSEKEVHFTLQMPHEWDSGQIDVHIHWIAESTAASTAVRWGIEWTMVEPNAVFGATTTSYSSTVVSGDTGMTAGKHQITEVVHIIPTSSQDGLSSILMGRLFRDSANAADTYTGDVGLLYVDAHFQLNSLGSTDEYTK